MTYNIALKTRQFKRHRYSLATLDLFTGKYVNLHRLNFVKRGLLEGHDNL